MKRQITGIILAGGQSSRLGREKGLVPFRGRPMIVYSVDVLSAVCSEILVSSNNDAYKHLDFRIIQDEKPGGAPMGGLYSCLKASGTDKNLVLPCTSLRTA